MITASTFVAHQGITIRADDANGANFIYIGLSTVTAGIAGATTDGYKLAAGESHFFPIRNIGLLFAVGSTTGLALSFEAS